MRLDEEIKLTALFMEGNLEKDEARKIVRALIPLVQTITPSEEPFPSSTFYFTLNGTHYRLRIEED
jgi:hypothetical protein